MASQLEKRVKGLLAQLNVHVMRLNRIHDFVLTLNDEEVVEAVSIRLTEAREAANQIKSLELDIINIKPDEVVNSVQGETLFYNIEAKLGSWLRSHVEAKTPGNMNDTMNTSQNLHVHDLRLPKAVVPTFDGNYMEWQSFHDLFCANIHDRTNLTPSQKFQFLGGYLKGEASNLIKHLQITDANYFEALEKLRDRYNRKKQIVNSYISTFLEQEPIQSSNVAGIRRLLDTSDEILRGLKALGSAAECRDMWIIRLLLNKLDIDTRERWAIHSKDEEFPTTKQFFKFLQGRIDALEDLKTLQGQVTSKIRKGGPAVRAHVSVTSHSQISNECPCCQKTGHKLAECITFNNLSSNDRRNLIQDQRRCFNCLNINHPVFRCMMRTRCTKWGKKHHSLLHRDESSVMDENRKVGLMSNNNEETDIVHVSQSAVVSSNVSSGSQTILPTAIVKFTTDDHQIEGNCRILLDSGSQVSFVSEAFIQRYQIPMTQRRLSVAGLGQVNVIGRTKAAVT